MAVDEAGRDPAAREVQLRPRRRRPSAGRSAGRRTRSARRCAAIAPSSITPRPGRAGSSVASRASSHRRSNSITPLPSPSPLLHTQPNGGRRRWLGCFSTTRSCPTGWAERRAAHGRGWHDRGRRARSRPRRRRPPRRRRHSGLAEPAQPRLPARHGRPRRDARARRTTVLDLARGDVPLPRPPRRPTTSRRSRAQPTSRCWRRASPRSASSTTCTTTSTAGPYADPAEMAGRIAAAAAEAGIGLTLLPCYYAQGGFGGAPPTPGQRRFVTRPGQLRPAARRLPSRNRRPSRMPRSASRRTRSARSRRTISGASCALAPRRPRSTSTPPSRCGRWRTASPGPAGARSSGCWTTMPVDERWCLIHATHMAEAETVALARSGAVAGLCPITEANLGDGIFPAVRLPRRRRPLRRRQRLATSRSTPPPSCGSSSTRQRLTHRARNLLAAERGRLDRTPVARGGG